MKNFQLVSEAVAKMNFGGESYLPSCESGEKDSKRYTQFDGDEEDSEELAEYEQIYENEGNACCILLQRKVYFNANLFLNAYPPQTVLNLIVVLVL